MGGVRVRLQRVRRARLPAAGAGRPAGGPHPHRALRLIPGARSRRPRGVLGSNPVPSGPELAVPRVGRVRRTGYETGVDASARAARGVSGRLR
ncbi:hypothetical protein SGPA1_21031 [Streptomyces misionensis JCM 4497]